LKTNSITLALACLLTGCAPRAIVRSTSDNPSLRFVLSPFQSSVLIRHLKYIHQAPKDLRRDEEKLLIDQEMTRVKSSLTDDFAAKLSSSPVFMLTPAAGAEVEIRVKLEAYGRVPAKWLIVLVGSGAGEAVAQGVIVAEATGVLWLAAGVSAEEMASESLTWLGGAFLTNRFLTPIILSCHVVRLRDHKTIWSKHIFSIYSHKFISKLPPDQRVRREYQLAAARDHALEKLTDALKRAWPKIARRLQPR
jgi:hypothetical protein